MSGIGAHTVIMPGCRLGFGSRVGACSFLGPFQTIPPFEIWAGCPARKIGEVKDKDRLKSIYARLIEGGQSLPLPMA